MENFWSKKINAITNKILSLTQINLLIPYKYNGIQEILGTK